MEQKTPVLRKILLLSLLLALFAAGSYALYSRGYGGQVPEARDKKLMVRVAAVRVDDVPVYVQALGTVTPPGIVAVKSRVDGQLMRLHFLEGQMVSEGDLLAEIDARPFEVQRKQALGALARDEAQLKGARLELERFRKLIKEHAVSLQQLQTQEALVGQYEGAVLMDKAAVADAELHIAYCRITAPISGRTGLKQVDAGNIIRASDAGGIVIITQTRPMDILFTLVEKHIPQVLEAMRGGPPLVVEAWGQDGKTLISRGALLSLDNQIDRSTGTVKARARFDNHDGALFPNQFVSVRLLVKTLEQVTVVPSAALQRGNDGFFAYAVANGAVHMRPVSIAYATAVDSVISAGLDAGDIVVIDGLDRLRAGASVSY
ncbi:MAG: MdtA/MuxA family multidrug efflux RND transporter periplasmic adaptor subunit [Desulfovibrio sp.]|nr:MdtA/MuxA family multidrug efflux RND transporter periplasmic adaptor subunit [Desulfovibrio sp.]